MRFTLLCLCWCWWTCVAAQEVEEVKTSSAPKASVAIQVSANAPYGIFGEYQFQPRASIWISGGFRYISRSISFGFDPPVEPALALQHVAHAQTYTLFRAGVRLYSPLKKEQWQVMYAPFVGYGSFGTPSDEYADALMKVEEHIDDLLIRPLQARQYIQLGGELGLRWNFVKRFYGEASFLYYGARSLQKNFSHKLAADARLAVGVKI